MTAAGGVAHAQEAATVAERAAVRAETPWYERFTYSHGPTEMMTGIGPSDRVSQPAWSLTQRWGITVDANRAPRTERLNPAATPLEGNGASVGAFYQFTPSMRVGGQVTVSEPDRSVTARPEDDRARSNSGVRIESAFRF